MLQDVGLFLHALASYQMRSIVGCACTGNAENVFPQPTWKETASLRSQHASRHERHACAVMHVGTATRGDGKTSPAFLAHAQPAILHIG